MQYRFLIGLPLSALIVALAGCSTQSIEAKVNTLQAQLVTDQQTGSQVVIGQEALNSAMTAINNAKSTIDLDMYEFTNQQILQALISAHKRGVKERVVLDQSSEAAAESLEHNGVTVHVEHVTDGIDHVKYLSIDNSKVLLGSVNFGQGSGKNEDASVWLPYTQTMGTFFNDTWNHQQPIMDGPSLYTGVNIQSRALALISRARSSIVIGMFAWTDTKTQYAVIDAAKRGVNVTVYIDGHQSENKSTIARLERGGVHVVEANSSQWLHLKALIVDDQYVLMGSCNWSYNGFHVNDELDFQVNSTTVANSLMGLLNQTT